MFGFGRKSQRARTISVMPAIPAVTPPNTLQSLNPYYFLLQVSGPVQQALQDMNRENHKHPLIELALVSYLMGAGVTYRTARAIVESWETDKTLLDEGFLRREPPAAESPPNAPSPPAAPEN